MANKRYDFTDIQNEDLIPFAVMCAQFAEMLMSEPFWETVPLADSSTVFSLRTALETECTLRGIDLDMELEIEYTLVDWPEDQDEQPTEELPRIDIADTPQEIDDLRDTAFWAWGDESDDDEGGVRV